MEVSAAESSARDGEESDSQLGPHVGTRLWPDGSLRRYPGNTVVCMVERDSGIALALEEAADILEAATGHHCAFLPASSWHMTILPLILDERRIEEEWTRFVSLNAPLEEVDRFFTEAVASTVSPGEIRMRPRCLRTYDGILLALDPADRTTEAGLDSYRERLSEVTGVRFAGHSSYEFHITLAYDIVHPGATEQRKISEAISKAERIVGDVDTFVLCKPELRFFDDMGAFRLSRNGHGASSQVASDPTVGLQTVSRDQADPSQ